MLFGHDRINIAKRRMKVKKLIFHLFVSILLIVSVSAYGSSSDLENKNKAVKEDKKKKTKPS